MFATNRTTGTLSAADQSSQIARPQVFVSGVALELTTGLTTQTAIQNDFITLFNANTMLQGLFLPAVTQGSGVRITSRTSSNANITVFFLDNSGDITGTSAVTLGSSPSGTASAVRIQADTTPAVDETVSLTRGLNTAATLATCLLYTSPSPRD